MRFYFSFLCMLCALALSSCVTTDTVRFDSIERPSKSSQNVAILTKEPDAPFSKIARLQVGPDAFIADYESQTKVIVDNAAELGADAVIMTFSSRTSGFLSGNEATGIFGDIGESKFTVGEAIVYD